jgi:hypothetical protein
MTKWMGEGGRNRSGMDLEGRGRGWRSCRNSHVSRQDIWCPHQDTNQVRPAHKCTVLQKHTPPCSAIWWEVYQWQSIIGGVSHPLQHPHPQSAHHVACDNLQLKSHKTYGPPTSVTWSQLWRKQASTGTSTALTAETYWSTRTRLHALSPLVTSV